MPDEYYDQNHQWLNYHAAAARVDRSERTIMRWHAEGMPMVRLVDTNYVELHVLLEWWRKKLKAHPFLQRHLARVRRERDEAEARAA